MEVVNHHDGLEVYERPPQSATQHSPASSPPQVVSAPHESHHQQHHQQLPYDPYYKSAPSSAITHDVSNGGQIAPAPPSQYYPDSPEAYNPKEKKQRGWLLPAIVGLVVAVLIGAAVGGGLGASLKSCESNLEQAKLSSGGGGAAGVDITSKTGAAATVTKTVTAGSTQPTNSDGLVVEYTPISPDKVGELADTCASLGTSVASTAYSDAYSVLCNKDLGSGAKGTGSDAVYMVDLMGMVAYTYRDCMDACSSYSDFSKRSNSTSMCRAFTFRKGLAGAYTGFKGANCWLKNATSDASNFAGCDECLSGQLR